MVGYFKVIDKEYSENKLFLVSRKNKCYIRCTNKFQGIDDFMVNQYLKVYKLQGKPFTFHISHPILFTTLMKLYQ